MSENDPVDTTSQIFTEAEVYMIGGYLAAIWKVKRNTITEDTEEAIIAVLKETNKDD